MPNSETGSSPWLNTIEAGEYLRISAASVCRYVRNGDLQFSRTPGVKGQYRFRREWLDDLLISRSRAGNRPVRINRQPKSFAVECPTLAEALCR